jgi:anhydro-N-acetylmuramic acid kinase
MFKEKSNVLGVMSGTSLDGIDLAHIEFTVRNESGNLKWNQQPYPFSKLEQIKTAINLSVWFY